MWQPFLRRDPPGHRGRHVALGFDSRGNTKWALRLSGTIEGEDAMVLPVTGRERRDKSIRVGER